MLRIEEGHFVDVKAVDTSPAGLTRAIAALSNAEGGELFIGIDENSVTKKRNWRGFANQEAANGHIQVFEQLFPLGTDYRYEFRSNAQCADFENAIPLRGSSVPRTSLPMMCAPSAST